MTNQYQFFKYFTKNIEIQIRAHTYTKKNNFQKLYFDQINASIQKKSQILVSKSTRYQILDILINYFKSFRDEVKTKKNVNEYILNVTRYSEKLCYYSKHFLDVTT